jgi:hypothetical protein
MAICQSEFGKLAWGSDFLAPDNDLTWGTGTVHIDGLGFVSVNEGSFEWTVDEGNGVLAITTDTGDNDNAVLMAGAFVPSVNGPLVAEGRFKFNSASLGSVFCGFTETLALDTPVMPAEFATATMTYNGTGQMLGALWDSDATAGDFRALSGDAGAVHGTDVSTGATVATAGVRANETITADEWYIVRVEIDAGGIGRVYVGHKGKGLDKILEVENIATTNPMYAVLMFENRSGAARVFEVDYFQGWANRDWEVT